MRHTVAVSNYEIFGLRIESEIRLPELFPVNGARAPDVTIRRGTLAADRAEPGVWSDGDGLVLTIPSVGRYRVEAGREIVVDAAPDIPERNIRLFLLGSAFGALLHQRGLLPLHANAVEVAGRAVAFMGESGAGKSTLAAWFHDRGFRVLADDVCVIDFDPEGRALVRPGLTRLRLWADALQASGRKLQNYQRSYADEEYEKFDVPMRQRGGASDAIEFAALYVLDQSEIFSIEPMHGVSGIEAVFANTYRGAYVGAVKAQHSHWRSSMQLVQRVPVYRARRPWSLDLLDETSRRIAEHAGGHSIDWTAES